MIIEVMPKATQLNAVVIVNAQKVKKQHSNLFKYGKHEFICEVGAPIVGGVIVFEADKPLYYTAEKFNKKYDIVNATPALTGNMVC